MKFTWPWQRPRRAVNDFVRMDDDLTIRQGDRIRAYRDVADADGETCATATLPAHVMRKDRGF